MTCEYCEEAKPFIKYWYGWNVLIDRDRRGKARIILRCVSGSTESGVAIKHCPMCGREL